jgi:hypothetical protein
VWTDNEKARAEIDREASALRSAAILATSFPTEYQVQLRELVRRYIGGEEWRPSIESLDDGSRTGGKVVAQNGGLTADSGFRQGSPGCPVSIALPRIESHIRDRAVSDLPDVATHEGKEMAAKGVM